MNILASLTAEEIQAIIGGVSAGVAVIVSAIGALIYKYKQAKKVDFKEVGLIISEVKKIADYFGKFKKK